MKMDPTIRIEGYEFKGVYTDTDGISDTQIGVYVIICLVDGDPQGVVDVGTTGEGSDPIVMKTRTSSIGYSTTTETTAGRRPVTAS